MYHRDLGANITKGDLGKIISFLNFLQPQKLKQLGCIVWQFTKKGLLQEKYVTQKIHFYLFQEKKIKSFSFTNEKKIHLSPSVDKAITAAKLKIIG